MGQKNDPKQHRDTLTRSNDRTRHISENKMRYAQVELAYASLMHKWKSLKTRDLRDKGNVKEERIKGIQRFLFKIFR